MHYQTIVQGVFLERPNRFIALVEIDGAPQICHVKNTGRCRELLIPGAQVFLEHSVHPARKTAYDLIAVIKNGRLINMDSQAPNKAAGEWLSSGGLYSEVSTLKPECPYGGSRLDFYVEGDGKRGFVEVKGVTLEQNGAVLFPDAPTSRGTKHLRELIQCVEDGLEAYVLFVIQMKGAAYFTPNDGTDPAFGQALRQAAKAGVTLLAYDCEVTPSSMRIANPVEICL